MRLLCPCPWFCPPQPDAHADADLARWHGSARSAYRKPRTNVGGTGIAFARCMACVRTLCSVVLLLGCYQSHRTELGDSGPPDSRPSDAARPDAPAADASVPEPCREVAAFEPVPITRSPPNDFNLGVIARSPTGGAGRPLGVRLLYSSDAPHDLARVLSPPPRTMHTHHTITHHVSSLFP